MPAAFYDLLEAVKRRDYATLDATLTREAAAQRDEEQWTLLLHELNTLQDKGASLKMVEYLLDRGVPVAAADSGQAWTALHFAARDHGPEVVRALLRAGAPIDAVNVFGNTPLIVAGKRLEVVEVLVAHGADPDKKNNYGNSARTHADAELLAALAGAATSVTPSRSYSPSQKFAVGDRLVHAKFGDGRVLSVKGDKIEVEFYEGRKTLLHGRRS